MKYIDVKHHMVRDLQEQGLDKLDYCTTKKFSRFNITHHLDRKHKAHWVVAWKGNP